MLIGFYGESLNFLKYLRATVGAIDFVPFSVNQVVINSLRIYPKRVNKNLRREENKGRVPTVQSYNNKMISFRANNTKMVSQ